MGITNPFCILIFLGLSTSLFAQNSDHTSKDLAPRTGFWITGELGTFFEKDGLSADRTFSPIGLELNYQKPLSNRLSVVTGFGLQYREQEIITASGEPCVFPLGLKVVDFIDSESYTANQIEAFLKVGLSYEVKRFSISVAALPAVRINNQLTYRFYRDFTIGNRPDAEIEQRIRSGETVDLAAIGSGPRAIQYANKVNLQAELALGYRITPRIRFSLAVRPVLSAYDLTITNQSFCNDFICVDYTGESESIGTLRGTAALVRISYGF